METEPISRKQASESEPACRNEAQLELDVWESLFIRVCKSNSANVRKFRRLLSWRNGLELRYVEDMWVAEFLVDIISKFQFMGLRGFIVMMHPSQKWKYGCNTAGCEDEYTATVIAAACSVLRHIRVEYLPGYRRRSRSRRDLPTSPKQPI
jgi:hypothetical protein